MTSVGSFASIIKRKQKDWDCPELMTRAVSGTGKKLPFSSPLLNWCTYGGIPRDCYSEFFGAPGGGKSTTSIDVCKNAIDIFKSEYSSELQRLRDLVSSGKKEFQGPMEDLEECGPKKVLYVDLENSFDAKWAQTLGIDREDIVSGSGTFSVMSVPNVAAEDVLQTVLDLVQTDEVGLVVIDSIPSLVPRQMLEKQMGERTVAALAGCLNVFFVKAIPLLKKYNCTLLAINQVRDNMDNPYVTKTPGGNAPKFYASLRMEFRIGNPVDVFGNELPKNTEDGGIREDFDYAKLAVNKYQIIRKQGAWFTMCNPYTGEVLENESGNVVKVHGMNRVYDFLHENAEYYELIKKYVVEDLSSQDHLVSVNG